MPSMSKRWVLQCGNKCDPCAFSVASRVLPTCTLEKTTAVQNDLELGIGQEDTCSHAKWRLSRKFIIWGEDCSKLCASPDIQKLMLALCRLDISVNMHLEMCLS